MNSDHQKSYQVLMFYFEEKIISFELINDIKTDSFGQHHTITTTLTKTVYMIVT